MFVKFLEISHKLTGSKSMYSVPTIYLGAVYKNLLIVPPSAQSGIANLIEPPILFTSIYNYIAL